MGINAAEFAPMRFSTDDVTERDRLPRWREEFGRVLVRVDIEPLEPDAPFHAEAILQLLPGVAVASCTGSAARLHRTRALAADGDDSIGLIVNLGDSAFASQRGIDITLQQGDAILVRPDEPGILCGTNHLNLLFPRAVLAQRADVDAAVMRVIPDRNAALGLLVDYVRLVQDERRLEQPAMQEMIVGHIHDLAALALGANRDTRESGLGAVAAARLTAVLADINRSFADPALTLEAVARRQGVSPRYLQRLLEESGASFTARVTELRLQRAFVLLSKAQSRGRRISEIAWQAGFSDVSHFNRLFRARFGGTPSGSRA